MTNLENFKFNKLTVISKVKRKKYERTHYKCLCECGNTTIVDGSKLKNGHTKSCGCIRQEVDYGIHRMPKGEANKNALINTYHGNAKNKSINFELSDEEMVKLFKSNCFYCNRKPYNEFKKKGLNGGYLFNGIDRLNNEKSIGYKKDNVVACCSECNYIKNNMNYEYFFNWIKTVYKNLKNYESKRTKNRTTS